MTTIEEALYSKLSSEVTVTTLTSTRIYPTHLPQNPTYPAIAYLRVSADRMLAHDGVQDYSKGRFQIDCFGSSYSSAKGVANAVRGVLNAFTGTVSTVEIHNIWSLSENDNFEPVSDIYRISLDFDIHYKE